MLVVFSKSKDSTRHGHRKEQILRKKTYPAPSPSPFLDFRLRRELLPVPLRAMVVVGWGERDRDGAGESAVNLGEVSSSEASPAKASNSASKSSAMVNGLQWFAVN